MRSSSGHRLRWVLAGALFVGAAFAAVNLVTLRGSAGVSHSPLSEFKSLSATQLEELQVKLTWGGPQRKSVASVGFTSSAGTFDVSAFAPFQRRPASFYVNDSPLTPECSASTSELQTMIGAVNALPITGGGGFGLDMPGGVLSFMLLTSETSNPSKDMAFEAILDEPTAQTLLLTVARAAVPCLAPLQRLWLSVGMPIDYDKDGCNDADELGARELRGGRRDPANEWDYFNPTKDGQNRVDDILMVVMQYFIDDPDPAYTTQTDRTLLGPEDWNLGPPNGQHRVDDILHSVHQYFHDC